MTKIAPKSENDAKLIDSEAMLNRGLRNRLRSSIGDARAQLPGQERGAQGQGGAEGAEDDRVQPALVGRLDDRVDQRDEGADRQQRAGDVEPAGVRVARLGHQPHAGQEGHERHRHVDKEDRVPVEVLEQQAADERAEADADRGRAGPDADRLSALVAREDVRDDRQRRRHDQRAADAHDRPDGDELSRGLDEEDRQAREAEQRDACLQGALAAEAIAERAEREKQAGERHQVRVDHPLQRRAGCIEVLLQGRQGDVEDRVVEPDDDQAQRQDAKCLPAAGICGRCGHGVMVRSPGPGGIVVMPSRCP